MYPGDSQSDFRISSPLKPTDGFDTEGAQIQLPVVKRSSDQNSAQGMILLVDDEEVTRRLLAHQLEAAGYEIITASNGYEALMLVRASKPDLVLMDISMPVMDGLTSLRMMRQLYNNADLPIVMMTSDAEEAQVGGCFDAGASDYLAKPVQHESMLARIEAQLKLMRVLSALRESEQRYTLAAQGTRDGIWDWNLETGEIYLSPRWRAMVGVQDSNWVAHGSSWLELVFEEDRERVRADLEAHLSGESSKFETELRMQDQSGGFRWMLCRGLAVRDQEGIPTRIAGSLTDITEGKVADALTGLPNRTLFHDRVERSVQQFTRNGLRQFAVLYIDVDDFKLINDSMGHDAGDEFLIQIANRLETSLRQTEAVLARLGGDEFGILIDGISRVEEALAVAERIQDRIKAPFSVSNREVLARISIGVVVVSKSNASVEKIIRQADTAMYYAKQFSQNGISMFEERMHRESAARLEIATELKDAIRRDEFSLNYQPIIDSSSMQTAGFETLLRWVHPVHGNISPVDFIPIAESNGMIVEIGNWVLKQSCIQAADWNRNSDRDIQVSVNVSIRQFSGQNFIEQVRVALAESGLAPEHLKLEVTESLLMQKPEEMIDLLLKLEAMHVTTSIDDFGTGYSSLSYLHQMPLKILKIDRSFVADLSRSKKHQAIVRSIIGLARSLELKVIAEGIETIDQAAYLQGLQCEYFQGYLYSKPVTADETYAMLDADWSTAN